MTLDKTGSLLLYYANLSCDYSTMLHMKKYIINIIINKEINIIFIKKIFVISVVYTSMPFAVSLAFSTIFRYWSFRPFCAKVTTP